jgi:hypothetical protein
MFLNKLDNKYNLSSKLFREIHKSLNYINQSKMTGLENFIEELPPHLKTAVTLAIHKETFKEHPAFKSLRNKRLLTFIGTRFRPNYSHASTFIYSSGE